MLRKHEAEFLYKSQKNCVYTVGNTLYMLMEKKTIDIKGDPWIPFLWAADKNLPQDIEEHLSILKILLPPFPRIEMF